MTRGKIISIHSYRGGTGKSSLAANLAACGLETGRRIAVLDTDLQSPGIHVLFGFKKEQISLTLVDFLWDRCSISETAYDVSESIKPGSSWKLWLVPASLTTQAITRILDEGYDVQRLNSHFDQLISEYRLDFLIIDTHPGLNRETLLTTAISDLLILLIRPDQQDYYGTAVLGEIARKLEIPEICVILNKVFSGGEAEQLKKRIQEAFGFPVIGEVPLSQDLARLESRDLLVRRYPEHPISHIFRGMAERIFQS